MMITTAVKTSIHFLYQLSHTDFNRLRHCNLKYSPRDKAYATFLMELNVSSFD